MLSNKIFKTTALISDAIIISNTIGINSVLRLDVKSLSESLDYLKLLILSR